MAKWQSRDVFGCLLLLLVITEAGRKWVAVSDLSTTQTKEVETTHDDTIHQVARRLLTPAKPGSQIPALCQTPEPECEEGVSVTCMHPSLIGCDCNFIKLCYPNASRCSRFNSTHTVPCGF